MYLLVAGISKQSKLLCNPIDKTYSPELYELALSPLLECYQRNKLVRCSKPFG